MLRQTAVLHGNKNDSFHTILFDRYMNVYTKETNIYYG